ncbi:hypothetical protein PACTADRAFT_48439 [Pachysolen tannophilus NRRL Y-2460]|uniref:Aspartate aminotransferase n=1 Tax=Pachysolen tannophilus NRRL Y-2460 TaxID=669874 RepID=A0A1E4TY67_PACTA|nr:hypothetical protein PACTADRAFT_48439 [Pachysolen tannophilus NRRL Y-2460]
MSGSAFSLEHISLLPADPLFGLNARYNADKRSPKVSLGIGAYRDSNGKPWILPSVKKAEELLVKDPSYNHEYLPISGLAEFTQAAAKVILGNDSIAIKEKRVLSIQSLSGTGALHFAGIFLKKFYKNTKETDGIPTVYVSSPTWGNHFQIFQSAGLKTATYPYWNNDTKKIDLKGFINTINDAPKGSIFLLHACAHNPTGLDPTHEQWLQILEAIKVNGHFSLFDSAYQGFTSGSLEEDAWAVRKAVELKLPLLICQSFAKNCGMYGERVGCVHIVLTEISEDLNAAILSQLNRIIRSEISNPPAYGAKVVSKILNNPELRSQWEQDLKTMSTRIIKMRYALRDELVALKTPGNWDHIVNQQGMFSFTALSAEEVKRLEEKHAVYLVGTGRASIAGLNEHNVKFVAEAIHEVVCHSNSKL